MRHPLIALGLLAVAGIVSPSGTAQVPPTSESDRRAEAEVRRLSALEIRAFLEQDPKTLANLWSDEFVVTNPFNKFVTKQQVLKMVESGALVITAFTRRTEYLHVYGDIVILIGSETVTWGGDMPSGDKTEQLRITVIWRNENGQWREVARHANIVPES
jgi:ketosteroid isomerase-like protein